MVGVVPALIEQKAAAAIINAMYTRTSPTNSTIVRIAPMSIIVPATLNRRSPERFAKLRNVSLKYRVISRLKMNTIAIKGRKYWLLKMKYCMSNMPELGLSIRVMRSVTKMPVYLMLMNSLILRIIRHIAPKTAPVNALR